MAGAPRRPRSDAPRDAVPIYRLADEVLLTPDRRAYVKATRVLKRVRAAARAAGQRDRFDETLLALRDRHRRRPSLIAMLDKAGAHRRCCTVMTDPQILDRLALIADPGTLAALGIDVEELTDPDVRADAIRRHHPTWSRRSSAARTRSWSAASR